MAAAQVLLVRQTAQFAVFQLSFQLGDTRLQFFVSRRFRLCFDLLGFDGFGGFHFCRCFMGYCNTYIEFPITGAFHYVGVRFLPSAFPLLFGQDAFEISAQEIPLREVVPALATFIAQQLETSLSLATIAQSLDNYFFRHLLQCPLQIDNRFFSALLQILQSKGTMHISELDTGISPRQLRRLFDYYYIGDNPKTFSNIVRFQHILSTKAYHNHSFLDTYYDQAHFIKSFKTFYGDTPSKVLG